MISKIGRIGRSVLFLSYLVVVCYCMNSFVCQLCVPQWVLLGWAEFWAWQPFVCVENRSDQAGMGQECSALWKEQPRSAQPLGFLLFLCNGMAVPWELLDRSALTQGEKAPTVIKHQGSRN